MVASLRDIAHRGDRVYLNIDRELANIWAVPYTNDAGGGGYGWLYRVRVDVDALEPDDDRLAGRSKLMPVRRNWLITLRRMQSLMVEVDADTCLHVGVTGEGQDVLVLSGGPGCVQYLENDEIAPRGFRAWYVEPRGVGRSEGGPHTMDQAVIDLEAIRVRLEVESWIVVGHSWGSDLAVRYAVEYPTSVVAVVGIAGRGPQRDATWSTSYETGRTSEPLVEIAWVPEVHVSLGASFTEWIHQPDLWRRLADCRVPMQFIAAGDDIRPSWPMQQLATLVPQGSFAAVPGVPHDFWYTDPRVWTETVTKACTDSRPPGLMAAGFCPVVGVAVGSGQ